MKILIVDDHPLVRDGMLHLLALLASPVEVLEASDCMTSLALARDHPDIDLVLLDLSLPDASGLDVLREIRAADGVESRFDPRLPVIVLTGRGAQTDRVRGLTAGADDYLTKPFDLEELRARIGAVLRRREGRREGPIRIGELTIDPLRRSVSVGEREVGLARKEFTLLRVLAADPTRVFSKAELLHDVWGYSTPGKTRTLDSHASRLRRKLDPEHSRYIVNCWGIGYRLLDG